METEDLEGGGTLIKLRTEEAAIVYSSEGTAIIVPPLPEIPENMALLLFMFALLDHDDEFLEQMREMYRARM